ncbi:hypothetical protein COLO4_17618 [Corchorus olitorius]|uniref:Uncharacterized protein n=1 Tax=Corchorus olitorius TaxID=93759 RepID=A0A1R3JC39_9ROSI|nr:hypothetical protein COLO4_17618 [Corchorus olitorius]
MGHGRWGSTSNGNAHKAKDFGSVTLKWVWVESGPPSDPP